MRSGAIANWDEDAFTNGANVVMPGGAGNRNNAIGAGRAVQSITFKEAALSYRIGTSNNNSGTADGLILSFRANMSLVVEAGNSANHSIGLNLNNANVGTIDLGGSCNVNHHGSGVLSLTRPVRGASGSITKNGSGELRLTAANTFSGGITVNAGTLTGAGAANSPGVTVFGERSNTRTITVNDSGILRFNSGNILGANHAATTAPTLVINSGGTVTNAAPASNNALHHIQLNGGTLTSTTGHQGSSEPFLPVYAAWNLNGKVTSTGESTISTSDSLRGSVMLKVSDDKTTEFDVVSGTLTISAPVIDNPTDSNIGSLNKTGAGALVLTAANTYTGTTTVNEGTLALVGASMTSAITVAEEASLGFTPGSPATSSSSVDLTAGSVKIIGTVDNATSYTLLTASGGITGTPALDAAIANYELQVQDSATKLVLVYLGGGDSAFGTWSGGAAPGEDGNGDGVPNSIAWLLGAASPSESATGLLPMIDNTSDPDYLLFTFPLGNAAAADTGTTWNVQYGTTLGAWTTAIDDGDNVLINSLAGSPASTVTVKLKRTTLAPGGKLFARLQVSVEP